MHPERVAVQIQIRHAPHLCLQPIHHSSLQFLESVDLVRQDAVPVAPEQASVDHLALRCAICLLDTKGCILGIQVDRHLLRNTDIAEVIGVIDTRLDRLEVLKVLRDRLPGFLSEASVGGNNLVRADPSFPRYTSFSISCSSLMPGLEEERLSGG